MKEEHVIVVQLARFGDLVQTSPLLQSLAFEPGVSRRVTLAVDRRSEPVAHLLAGVDDVIPIDLAAAASLSARPGPGAYRALCEWRDSWRPSEPADRVILLNHGMTTGSVARLIPAREYIGPFPGKPLPPPHRYLVSVAGDPERSVLHLSEVWAAYGPENYPLPLPRLKDGVTGTALAFFRSRLCQKPLKSRLFALNIGAGGQERILPAAMLAELARLLAGNGEANVLLLGMDADRSRAEEILNTVPVEVRENLVDLTGRTRIEDLPGILEACDVLVSSDTGTLQLAATTGTGTVGLFFNGANPVETGAYRPGAVALYYRGGEVEKVITPALVADVVRRVRENKLEEVETNGSPGLSVLVAGPSPVGVEYRRIGASRTEAEVRERRLAAARAAIRDGQANRRKDTRRFAEASGAVAVDGFLSSGVDILTRVENRR